MDQELDEPTAATRTSSPASFLSFSRELRARVAQTRMDNTTRRRLLARRSTAWTSRRLRARSYVSYSARRARGGESERGGRTRADAVLRRDLLEDLLVVELPELLRAVLAARLEEDLLAACARARGVEVSGERDEERQVRRGGRTRVLLEELGHVVHAAIDDDPGRVGRRVVGHLLGGESLRTRRGRGQRWALWGVAHAMKRPARRRTASTPATVPRRARPRARTRSMMSRGGGGSLPPAVRAGQRRTLLMSVLEVR